MTLNIVDFICDTLNDGFVCETEHNGHICDTQRNGLIWDTQQGILKKEVSLYR